MKKATPRSSCPLSFTLDLLGDKWSLLIIRDMIIYGKKTYGQFLQSEEKIATNILADRLASLEQNGFITKEAEGSNKTRGNYKMTQKSADLVPIIMEYYIWGIKYNPECEDTLLDKLLKDKQKTIKEYQDKILGGKEKC